MEQPFRQNLFPVLLLLGTILTGCSTEGVKLRKLRHNSPLHKMRAQGLSSSRPSPRTEQLLRRYDLGGTFKTNPTDVLRQLDEKVRRRSAPEMVFALAELCYLTGRKFERRSKEKAISHYLGSVAYAYYYLFDESFGTQSDVYDPRFRLACDLYNQSLTRCLQLLRKRKVPFEKNLRLPFMDGEIDIAVLRIDLPCNHEAISEFRFAADYEVRGLYNHYQTFGLGVPLIAVRTDDSSDEDRQNYYFKDQSFPVTVFLRMKGNLLTPPGQVRTASLEFYDPFRVQSLTVADHLVPLESDLTTPLGYFLSHARLERLEHRGLLRGESVQDKSGIYMIHPYETGKIPVVMIHGLWSSPMAWMRMLNDLLGDPLLREQYQFWYFLYPTGNPLPYSAAHLRQSLNAIRQSHDPEGEDPALDQMVLIGHSMGGLLAKMMVEESQNHLWDAVGAKPAEELIISQQEQDNIRQVFFYEPQHFVRRVLFIATPHRGSSLCKAAIGRFGSMLISLPRKLRDEHSKLVEHDPEAFKPFFRGGLPTSVDNLAPDSAIIAAIARMPIDPEVEYHSIIGYTHEDDQTQSSDGVVDYSSSHLEGATSEYMINSKHMFCQYHPLAILEVRRILLEHLKKSRAKMPIRFANGNRLQTDIPIGPKPITSSP